MGYIPHPHNKFNTWQKQFVTGLLTDPLSGEVTEFPPDPAAEPANWQNFAIPEEDMQELVDAQELFQPFYDKWSDEDARNRKIIEDHKRERATYEKFIRDFVAQWLRHNKKVNTGDKAGLGLTVPDTEPTAVTAVDYGPVLSIDTIRPLLHKIRIANPTNPDSQAMPEGHKLELQRFIGDANLPETELEWSPYKTVGKFLITSEFTAEDKGETAYYRAFYLTTRGDRSPASTVLEVGVV